VVWNHGTDYDFPETVGNGKSSQLTFTHSIIFQRGGSTTNPVFIPVGLPFFEAVAATALAGAFRTFRPPNYLPTFGCWKMDWGTVI